MLENVRSVDYAPFWCYGVEYRFRENARRQQFYSMIADEFGQTGKRYVLRTGSSPHAIRFRRPEDRFLFLLKFSG